MSPKIDLLGLGPVIDWEALGPGMEIQLPHNADYRHDPRRLLPVSDIKALGLGVETQGELEMIFRDNPGLAPPILIISGRYYIIAEDRDRFREMLIARALREAMRG